jgi:glyoxylase-like metal-dependent hydrolase (beta-lactamase superfamily II)
MSFPDGMRVLERGWLSSNCIVFAGAETVLVDSGYATHAAQTLALVDHALDHRPLERLINTHLHSDHCGGNAALQARHACRTTIPRQEADKVRDWDEQALSYRSTGQQCPRFTFDDTMASGDELLLGGSAWQVLAAPGHDPHSLVLYCPRHKILISADALWENGFGVVFPELEGSAGFEDTRATLELIAGLEVAMVIPGHGAPFTDIAGALRRAFSRIDYLCAEPARNAQYGVKALVKFLLLERERIPLDQLATMLGRIPILAEANRRYLRMSEQSLAQWVVDSLIRADVAAVEGGMLVNRG